MSTTSLKNISPAAALFYGLIQEEAFNECRQIGFRDAVTISMRAISKGFEKVCSTPEDVFDAIPDALKAIGVAMASNHLPEPAPLDYVRGLENDRALFEQGYPDEPYAYPSEILSLLDEAEECEASAKLNPEGAAAANAAAGFKRFCACVAAASIVRGISWNADPSEHFAAVYLADLAGLKDVVARGVDLPFTECLGKSVQLAHGEDGREIVGYEFEISPRNYCGIAFGESFHRFGSNVTQINGIEHGILCRLGVALGLPRAMYF